MIQKGISDKRCGAVRHQDNRHNKWRVTLIIAFCAALLVLGEVGTANAASGYAGIGIGLAKGKFDKDNFTFKAPDLARDEAMWRLFGGFQVNDNFGFEAGYIIYGKARVREEIYNDYFETKMTGFDLTPVGFLPVAKGLSVFARGGLVFWSSDIAFQFTDPDTRTDTDKKSGSGLALGFGAKFDIIKQFGVRAEYMRYAVDNAKAGSGDFNAISISAVFAFYR